MQQQKVKKQLNHPFSLFINLLKKLVKRESSTKTSFQQYFIIIFIPCSTLWNLYQVTIRKNLNQKKRKTWRLFCSLCHILVHKQNFWLRYKCYLKLTWELFLILSTNFSNFPWSMFLLLKHEILKVIICIRFFFLKKNMKC